MVKILIAEDIKRLADALIQKLKLDDNYDVKGAFSNGKLLIQSLNKNSNIDIILMDINMPVMSGIEATEIISNKWPHIKIIMSTVFDDDEHLFQATLAGAKGYLLKDESSEKIHQSIEEVLGGGAAMSSSMALKALAMLKQQPVKSVEPEFNLSTRESEVLQHLSTGLSYQEISNNLNVSNGTIRKHVENIYRKLQVHNKVEAVQKANKFKLFSF